MQKKILVLSNAYPLTTTQINVIAGSMWLHKKGLRKPETENLKIEIRLLPNPSLVTVKTTLKKFILFFSRLMPNVFTNFLIKRLSITIINFGISRHLEILKDILVSSKEKKIKNSFIRNLLSGSLISTSYKNWNIDISLYKFSTLNRLIIFLISFLISLKIYLSFYKNAKFQEYDFLSLKYDSTHIGDLIASYTVRVNPKYGGELKSSVSLFFNLLKGIYYCRLSDLINLDSYSDTYIIPTEPFYIHQIWVRRLNSKGVKILDTHNRFKEFNIVKNINSNPNNWHAPPPDINKYSSEAYEDYFNKKLYSPELVVDTFLTNDYANDNDSKKIFDIYDNEIFIYNKKINSIIFLQSFEDALYDDGYDDKFKDIYEWTLFTIDNCLLNNEIQNVYIKPHPNVEPINYPANAIAINKLIKKYFNNKRVIFLNKKSSIVLLSRKAKFYGFTRCGTIIEEMTYLGQPMIAWAKGPWLSNYKFMKVWKNIDDYKLLISGLNELKWTAPSKEQLESLRLYVNNFSLKNIGLQKKTVRLFLSEKIFNDKNLDHIKFENYLSNMKLDSDMYLKVIHSLYNEFIE